MYYQFHRLHHHVNSLIIFFEMFRHALQGYYSNNNLARLGASLSQTI